MDGADLNLDDVDTSISDDDLTKLALAGDPDAPLPSDAVPFNSDPRHPDAVNGAGLLPSWYMPAPAVGGTSHQLTGWRRRVAWTIVAGFIGVVTSGLCNTYGILQIA